jgi:hypothetical protein
MRIMSSPKHTIFIVFILSSCGALSATRPVIRGSDIHTFNKLTGGSGDPVPRTRLNPLFVRQVAAHANSNASRAHESRGI